MYNAAIYRKIIQNHFYVNECVRVCSSKEISKLNRCGSGQIGESSQLSTNKAHPFNQPTRPVQLDHSLCNSSLPGAILDELLYKFHVKWYFCFNKIIKNVLNWTSYFWLLFLKKTAYSFIISKQFHIDGLHSPLFVCGHTKTPAIFY